MQGLTRNPLASPASSGSTLARPWPWCSRSRWWAPPLQNRVRGSPCSGRLWRPCSSHSSGDRRSALTDPAGARRRGAHDPPRRSRAPCSCSMRERSTSSGSGSLAPSPAATPARGRRSAPCSLRVSCSRCSVDGSSTPSRLGTTLPAASGSALAGRASRPVSRACSSPWCGRRRRTDRLRWARRATRRTRRHRPGLPLTIPLAGVLGGAFLLAADTLGRLLTAPAELQVGIVTALPRRPVLPLARPRAPAGGRMTAPPLLLRHRGPHCASHPHDRGARRARRTGPGAARRLGGRRRVRRRSRRGAERPGRSWGSRHALRRARAAAPRALTRCWPAPRSASRARSSRRSPQCAGVAGCGRDLARRVGRGSRRHRPDALESPSPSRRPRWWERSAPVRRSPRSHARGARRRPRRARGDRAGRPLHAAISFVLTKGRIFEVSEAYVWLVGTVNGRSWDHVLPLALAACL